MRVVDGVVTETGWGYCFAGWDLKLSEAPVVAFYWLFDSLSIVLFSFHFTLDSYCFYAA